MRDMQEILSRWGVWARDNSGIDYSPIAAGFKGLLPPSGSSKPSCSDDDGLVIDGCVARLKISRVDEFELIILHYIYNVSKREIGRRKKKSEKLIRIKMMLAEGFIEGCLSTLSVTLGSGQCINKALYECFKTYVSMRS